MKKYISKLIITLTLICLIQSKLPYFYFEIPYIQHLESVAPYNDIPLPTVIEIINQFFFVYILIEITLYKVADGNTTY